MITLKEKLETVLLISSGLSLLLKPLKFAAKNGFRKRRFVGTWCCRAKDDAYW